jgi:nidogen (entactin)
MNTSFEIIFYQQRTSFFSKLYWSDWDRVAPKIESANLDGSDRQTILTSPEVKLPNSLSLSLSSGELCYADAGNQKIECEHVLFSSLN